MPSRTLAAAAIALALVGASCARPPEAGAPQSVGASVRPTSAKLPAVGPETMLDVELLDALGTDTSVEGQRFRAVLRADVFDEAGAALAERGAILYGAVARVAGAPKPYLALDFERMRTARGDAPIAAKLEGAEAIRVPGVAEDWTYDPRDSAFDAVFAPSYPPGATGYAAPGESVLYVDYYDERARAIRLPVGAVLLLTLRAPLVPAPPPQ